ncbi:methionine--tRNA ligase [Rhizobium sp. 2YAF20]|uniref:methionine--tRNA ligase n=1 Tax=Rhizobium sp. 2YAF20 TaxID=3233027 RepID=UPI003F9925E1
MNEEHSHKPVRYVTTAIPYVNSAPHVGFALEAIQADTLARYYRLSGGQTRFLSGTDENSIKNVQAAQAAGLPIESFIERNSSVFRDLENVLALSYDDFIRTSSDARHLPGATKLWRRCFDRGDIYKRQYEGLYCIGCEQFYKPEDLCDGRCPEHGTRPDLVSEENWFFRLSRYQDQLKQIYATNQIEILPEKRRNEVLAWLEKGLEDFSISRSQHRAQGWGIPVPDDPEQVMYVWFDALANYITALGYGADEDLFFRYWQNSQSREHFIGKGITRFHALYWPAILLSAGIALPTRLFVHGYVTAEGKKIGKSAGNTVDPVPIVAQFGTDALRYYLLRHIRSTSDGDFSKERLERAYDSELAGQLGNLVHRVLSMVERYFNGSIQDCEANDIKDDRLIVSGERLMKNSGSLVESYTFDRLLDEVWGFVAECNRYVAEEEPWALAKSKDENDILRLKTCLSSLSGGLFIIAKCIAPVLPYTSRELLKKLGASTTNCDLGQLPALRISRGKPLFPARHDRSLSRQMKSSEG